MQRVNRNTTSYRVWRVKKTLAGVRIDESDTSYVENKSKFHKVKKGTTKDEKIK